MQKNLNILGRLSPRNFPETGSTMSPLSFCILAFALFGKASVKGETDMQPAEVGPLHAAILDDDIHLLQELLDDGEDINQKAEESGQTPLMQAILAGKIEAAELLLHAGADTSIPESSGPYFFIKYLYFNPSSIKSVEFPVCFSQVANMINIKIMHIKRTRLHPVPCRWISRTLRARSHPNYVRAEPIRPSQGWFHTDPPCLLGVY